ncbi:MAG: hypothetical protein KDA68_04235 [Planctomycetaceae bacterium]|nr:hypothetical protein [Planctomycetaceae bacterium]
MNRVVEPVIDTPAPEPAKPAPKIYPAKGFVEIIPEQSTADTVWGIGILMSLLAGVTTAFSVWFANFNKDMIEGDRTLLSIGCLMAGIITGFLVFLPFNALSAIISLLVKILRKL